MIVATHWRAVLARHGILFHTPEKKPPILCVIPENHSENCHRIIFIQAVTLSQFLYRYMEVAIIHVIPVMIAHTGLRAKNIRALLKRPTPTMTFGITNHTIHSQAVSPATAHDTRMMFFVSSGFFSIHVVIFVIIGESFFINSVITGSNDFQIDTVITSTVLLNLCFRAPYVSFCLANASSKAPLLFFMASIVVAKLSPCSPARDKTALRASTDPNIFLSCSTFPSAHS